MTTAALQAPASAPPKRMSAINAVLALLVYGGLVAGPFLGYGSWRWWVGWFYLGAHLVIAAVLLTYVRRKSPGLREARKNVGEGTKGWDKVWLAVFWPLMVATVVLAGVDRRFDWSPMMPVAFLALGVVLAAGGFTLSARAMAVNPFFEGTARIQTDRGHRVIDTGPYARVRHPGYLGLALWGLSLPFMLLSWCAIGLGLAIAVWLVIRTLLEDRMLQRELPGYPEYAARVRHRLVPGLW